ncbi:MAG TPA: DUF6496 domain-containing protein [Polyangiaceae bacterium]|nr:DUF6496 domain-containing protein [Polyangiaceae bacterium]
MAHTKKRSARSRASSDGKGDGKSSKRRSSQRRYGDAASKKVGRALHEAKRGTLRSGRSKKKVKSRKQAIAIGLSEARSRGAKVPKPSSARAGRRSK